MHDVLLPCGMCHSKPGYIKAHSSYYIVTSMGTTSTRGGGEDTNEHAGKSRTMRAVTYNLGQGGRRDAGSWLRLLLLTCEVLEDEAWCALSDHNPVVATFASANS